MPGWPNPFQITKPVGPDDVIDRDTECGTLVQLAEEGNNARLVAPRRYGKTSLVNRVQGQLKFDGWHTVYVDLLGIVTLDDLSNRIERAYSTALKGSLARWFTALRRSWRPQLTAGGGPIPASGSVDLSGPSKATLTELLDLPKKVHTKTEQRVHVVFDEFQELAEVDDQADAIVRSVIQHHGEAASYLFAGSHLSMMEMLFTNRRRAFYGQTKPVSLKPLDPVDLAEYIDSRFERTDKEITTEALDNLLGLVAGHPQRAMVAAHALWNATDHSAGPEEWMTAYDTLMIDVADELQTMWLGLNATERSTLVAIAEDGRPFRRRTSGQRGGSVARARDDLEGRGIITKAGELWVVVDPFLAEWTRNGRGG